MNVGKLISILFTFLSLMLIGFGGVVWITGSIPAAIMGSGVIGVGLFGWSSMTGG